MRSGRAVRRHRAGAGGDRHQRRAPAQAAAHRAPARLSVPLHRPQARATGSGLRRGPDEAAVWSALERRTFLIDELADVSRPGELARASGDDTAFIQFSSGSTSDPKGVVLTHANIIANAKVAPGRRLHENGCLADLDAADARHGPDRLPPDHDVRGVRQYLMPTELFVRRPLLWMNCLEPEARHDHVLAEFRLPALPEGAGRQALDGTRPVVRAADLQRRRTHLGGALPGVHRALAAVRTRAAVDVSRSTGWRKPRWP